MNRRNVLKNLAIVSGGSIILPQWMISCGVSDTTTHKTSFSPSEGATIGVITDTIIPTHDGIGAIPLGVYAFLIKLLDDCYEKNVRDNVKTQLKKLDAIAKKSYNRIFASCEQSQRELLLLKFSNSANKQEKDFFDLMKTETIRGFNTSQKVMTEYLGYKVVPGHYYGCVDVNQSNHA